MPARSIRWRRACCRSRSARRPRRCPMCMDGAKVYRFTVAWGEERSTDDLEGPVTKTSDMRPSRGRHPGAAAEIHRRHHADAAAILRDQDRRRARLRPRPRAARTVDIPAREIEIGRLDLVEMTPEGNTVFEIECGKGTYVRSLARDIGRDLGCFGHIAELRRSRGRSVHGRRFRHHRGARNGALRRSRGSRSAEPVDQRADGFRRDRRAVWSTPAPRSNACRRSPSPTTRRHRIRLGNPVIIRGRDAPVEAEEACATARGRLVAIGAIEAGMFKPKRVFAG